MLGHARAPTLDEYSRTGAAPPHAAAAVMTDVSHAFTICRAYTEPVMSLAEEADARKVRLLDLRKKKEGANGNEQRSSDAIIKGRNFDPESRTLRKRKNEDEELDDTVEKDVAGLAERIVAEDEENRAQDLDLTNIAPKRPNWDLKRELERKMSKLERKTQEAIHTLIRQRLAAQKGESEDIFEAMRANEGAEANSGSSDEE